MTQPSTQLSTHLKQLQADGKKALLAYLVAGDPHKKATVPMMRQLVESGVDVIEVGVPFSDPEAEGPVIQLGHERALAGGTGLADCLDMVADFRRDNQTTPVLLMGYLNPIETQGYQSFAAAAAKAGVNGTIIVNLPPEEAGELDAQLAKQGLESVYLLAPTSTDDRARMICEASKGFVYYVSLKGTTGAATLDVSDVQAKLKRFKAMSSLPVIVGFGVKDPASAKSVAAVADGVVVGSAIVSLMAEHREDEAAMLSAVGG
ncbi:MAG: tryptophan synthase subunit alpha, partial [Pseudomonadales bacterium]